MCMYKMKPTGEQINLVGNKRLSEIIQDAKHSLLSTLENNYKSDSAKLVEWRYSRDMCAVYIILDSTGQETALGCPTFDYYISPKGRLIYQSISKRFLIYRLIPSTSGDSYPCMMQPPTTPRLWMTG